jgi:hypothetical protein
MRTAALLCALAVSLACATAKTDPIPVKVFQIDVTRKPSEVDPVPSGCKLLQSFPPFDQMAKERLVEDPYKARRKETLALGGNMLLVRSEDLVVRPNLDCPPADQSPGCLSTSQNWYRVTLEGYSCSTDALRELTLEAASASDQGTFLSFPLASKKVSPELVKEQLIEMQKQGVGPEVMVTYVKGQHLKRKLTAQDILDWKRAGLPDEVIQAAAAAR